MRKLKEAAVEEKQGITALYNIWPWAVIAVVIIAAAVIRGRLLALPLERDEGEYAYIAQQMLKGVPPYVSAYSMKLPGIYVVYAMIMAVFGETQTGIHLGLLVFNAGTIFVIFLLAKRLFGSIAGVMAGGVYAAISLIAQVNGLWANAEHFVILPALIGVLLIYRTNDKTGYLQLFISGTLFGLAFIIKQHGIMFAIFGALYLLYGGLCNKPIQWIRVVFAQIAFAAGAIMPFALVCAYFFHYGIFDKFWFWTFTSAREYATKVTLANALMFFNSSMGSILKESYPIWLLGIAGLFAIVFIKRYRQQAVFIIWLLIFSFLAVCPGFYFREHYFIFILPAAAILAGAGLGAVYDLFTGKKLVMLGVVITVVIGLFVIGYTVYNQRIFLFDESPERICRIVYDGNPFPESLPIAEYIRHNSGPDDTVAVVGSEPQIYFYSGRRSATTYIYMYPLMEPNSSAQDMQKEMISQIEKARPRFLVYVKVRTSWIPRPGSVQDIFEWFEQYAAHSYDMVGMIDIPESGNTVYHWNNEAEDRTPALPESWVGVFKRR